MDPVVLQMFAAISDCLRIRYNLILQKILEATDVYFIAQLAGDHDCLDLWHKG